eukprot:8529472-Pyramimonas_sp.AAC.1
MPERASTSASAAEARWARRNRGARAQVGRRGLRATCRAAVSLPRQDVLRECRHHEQIGCWDLWPFPRGWAGRAPSPRAREAEAEGPPAFA